MDHVANYPILRKLGEGATSEVFLCQDPFRGREVAVKRIFPEALRDPVRGRLFRKLFFTEASLAGKLQHPHIAQIYDAGIGEELVDHRTDLYSLGVVMYQLLVGRLPFQATNKFSMIYQITQHDPAPPSALRPVVPASLDRIVRRAMQKDAAKRYHSGDEFAEDLIEALRAGLGEAARETFGDADKFALLRSMRFFSTFVDQELWEVVKLGIWDRVAAGKEVVHEGEVGDFFCILIEGEMRVSKNKKLLTVLGAGECFGEMAYLSASGQTRGATVAAGADSRTLRIRVADLEQASVSRRSKFDRAFIGILGDRLTLANTRLTSG